MVDWLAVWGVANAVGFVFKPILEDIAKDAAKDYTKDFFKDCLKSFLRLPKKEPLDIAAGKALKEFLQLVQQELEDADLPEGELQMYTKPLKHFINNKAVKEILGSAFNNDCQALNTRTLAKTWNDLNLRSLPDEFDWEQIARRYLKKVKAIIRESDELRSLLDSQNLEAAQEGIKEIAGIPPDFDLSRYREGIQEQYGNLKLESLDTSGYAYNELKLWRMFVAQNVREVHQILPQIHEIPKEHQKRLRESNQLEAEISTEELERYKEIYNQQPIRSVLEIVEDKVGAYGIVGAQGRVPLHTVILGDPGAGKSTLLQYIALNWAEQPLKDLSLQPIPLLIELRTYIRNWDSQQCKDFLEFFHQGSGIVCRLNQHQLHERLKAGNAIVMFDGLDEVFDPAKREDVIKDIIRFTNDYPKVRVIVTSRVIGYKVQELRNAKFRHFMLQDLESEPIKDFINRWHDLTFKDEADKVRKRDRLQTAIDTSSSIRELAGNPLLLTMMAILNRHQELPRDRPELYNQASRVLLHQWDVERALMEDTRLDPKTIDYKDKHAMLRQVAYHMQANEKGLAGNLISADDLERILTGYLKTIEVSDARAVARLMINQLRTRNFILCFMGADYYAFVHRTFLEYFCAWEFVRQFEKERTISLDYLKNEVFGKHWQDVDQSWPEVLRLIVGMIDERFAGEIIDYLLSEDELNGEIEYFNNVLFAADCLAEVRNKAALAPTANKLLNKLKGLVEERDCDELLTVGEFIVMSHVRNQAVVAIATAWKDQPDTFPWLKICAQDEDAFVRQAAVQELARGWKDCPETLTILKTLAQSDAEAFVRQAAQEGLARG
jgi:predicted NACHT family NTPase